MFNRHLHDEIQRLEWSNKVKSNHIAQLEAEIIELENKLEIEQRLRETVEDVSDNLRMQNRILKSNFEFITTSLQRATDFLVDIQEIDSDFKALQDSYIKYRNIKKEEG